MDSLNGKPRIAVPPGVGFQPWPEAAIEGTIVERFEEIVNRYPDRLAVKGGGKEYSYAELNREANRLAWAIVSKAGRNLSPAAIFLPHSSEAILAILAILKAGKFCLPLDLSYPVQRNAGMISDSRCSLLITDLNHAEAARALGFPEMVLLLMEEGRAGEKDVNLNLPIPSEALFNLTYTSGSTGGPKGVLQTHRNILHNTLVVTDLLKLNLNDRFTVISPFTFGASVADVFGGLLNGASIFPFDVRRGGIQKLAAWLDDEKITVYHSVPTI